ncbi:hypothetical protein IAT38_002742 [Cryptococcus sp. DSM 104549]
MAEPAPLSSWNASYHWRNKNCAPFAYDWIKKTLPGTKVSDGALSAAIDEVSSVSGDCDLGQRKGKVLTIYDLEVQMKWTGTAKDGSEVKGSVKVPEVSHEAIDGLSEYVYEFSSTTSTPASAELVSYLRKSFPPILSAVFNDFRPALLAAHGGPSAGTDSPSASGASSPAPAAAGAAYVPAPPAKDEIPAKKPEEKAEKGVEKTVTVEVKADLQASADDLWGLLTDAGKIPMWSRSAAKMSLTPGDDFEIFGGNVRGKIVSAEPPKKLVQTWQARSPNWPAEHYGTMTLTLNQGSDSTSATFTLDGVPAGSESDVEKALNTFYIQGLKQMGLVLASSSKSFRTPLSSSTPTSTSKAQPKGKRLRRKQPAGAGAGGSSWPSTSTIVGGAAVAALSAVLVGLVVTSFPSSAAGANVRSALGTFL